ncbi:hypothetical protein A3H80_05205 [Candidatus Roizmanbacteria bacterium RIFCSPLOWO2_02_FULL_37_19]|uniref:Clp R domain-containing protein n=1 Tax=Candidatus Roizmanbacteria bacterium RIFCSPHIGHO2_02_FULL_37_24 TaxID=1802037 RepID=A0A1F7GXG5_9BACT|nr:MAG: hypothetical protein A2862_01075 [Candidatus Roizmanbacteria bacterium RIFCSPHIGHO2_01_FULL_38_41]OGK23621.1 MAG: hypothetical protein A3C24_05470 [Candidatus Roizmanbacteria bacterium RIFCSPHIGHO2_02_FULL_37_24]OGK32944.1 MAG: hypothetical protein A3E10_05515 [Candidatus Roizmanbacteria bacterium RIFCSPHIGHO2_12_FULL_37_23]OGK44003.1 MAG: hypothetical protein A2956_01145 [Candidatus Roizmanbacteria bacterium RIFCSPLOWO2_01_FULL_37_57]OGK54650.1 MAG: hypothetical protein A3H80_05205 [Ca
MAVLDFFKKKPSDSSGVTDRVTTDQTNAQNQPTQQTTQQVTTESTSVVSGGAQRYSGIGNPPGGKAYSGIGNPPQQPAQTVTETKVEQVPPTPDKLKPTGNEQPISSTSTPQQTPMSQADKTSKQPEKTEKTAPQQQGDQKEPVGQASPKPLDSNIDQQKRTQLDLMTHLTQRSNRVFVTAQQKAQELKSDFVDSEHVLHGLLADPEIYKYFTENKIPPQTIEQELEKVYKKGNAEKPQISPRVKRILENGLVVARKLGYEFISPEHILLSLFEEGEGVGARVLAKLGLKKEDLNKKITGKKEGVGEKGKEGEKSQSTLAQFTVDLTEKAAQGQLDLVVERSDVIERVIHIISRRTKNNPSLIGEAGVGKTAIVEGLAQKIVKKEVPESLLNKKILQLDLMSIIAGASHRGEFEERMKKIIEEIISSQGQIILFIDEIHNLVGAGAGGEGALDASNFLKPSLARGELQVIGATTLTEYRKYIEKDPALERRFQPVIVPEPTPEQAIKMLKAIRDKYEAFHRVKIPNEAIEAAVNLSKRYVGDRFLPDKAVDLIDEAGAAVRLPLISLPEEIRSSEERIKQLSQELQEAEKSGNRVKANILRPKLDDLNAELKIKQDEYAQKKSQTTTAVTEQIIKDIVSRWTGIPISKITESEVEKLTKLEDIIHERLINQDHAVEPVAQAIRRGRAGLKSTNRPIGSFVFLGPTGVGKTELGKTLAEVLFGQEEAMIRFDMTEYMEKHEVAKLLGAPPGYVGYEEGGKLTEAVRRKPYSVILFDEVEKAHPDIFNILLQILDDGRLTDNKGHVISFKNTVVVTTSNIGTKLIQDEIMAQGQVDIEEPTVISTYTFSPRGRQILTIMGKVFERESEKDQWNNKMLIDYFAGQKIESQKKEPPVDKPTDDSTAFPGKEFDTHAISPEGVEVITTSDHMYQRTSTTAKVWQTMSLIDYFKDNLVINALPDAPDQQLPTVKLKTQAFNPSEFEIVSFRDRYWKRKSGDINWETGTLKEYFKGETVDGTPTSQPKAQQDLKQKNIASPKAAELEKTSEQSSVMLPVNYWDIHAFTPTGDELIIVGEKVWTKEASATTWKMMTLKEYFGSAFPLDQELEEKRKIEEELSKNKYEKIKTKVMEELRKFFRPELINRFDEVIIFEPLKYQHMLKIVELQLKALGKLMEDQGIGFTSTETAAKEIVRQGFDPLYGARPLKRTIQKLIENPISTFIIEQKVKEGDLIAIDFDGENFVFNIEKTTFVTEDELNKQKLRKFMCINSRHMFETEVAKNATTVCPINATEPVQEVIEKTEEVVEGKAKPYEEKGEPREETQITEPKIDIIEPGMSTKDDKKESKPTSTQKQPSASM